MIDGRTNDIPKEVSLFLIRARMGSLSWGRGKQSHNGLTVSGKQTKKLAGQDTTTTTTTQRYYGFSQEVKDVRIYDRRQLFNNPEPWKLVTMETNKSWKRLTTETGISTVL